MTLFNRKLVGSLALALALALAIGVCAQADDPSPAALQKAEAAYRDAFGAAHEKATKATKPADKSDFAKRLFDASLKAPNDPALQEVLRKYALAFAQTDAVGTAVAMDVHRAYLAFPSRRAVSMEKLGGLYERSLTIEPPANRPKIATEAVKWYRDAIAEYEKQGNAASAIAVVAKVRTLARKYTPNAKDIFAALDADERRLQSQAADQTEIERIKQTVEKSPDDLKARAALGCRYLRLNRVRDAADQFKLCGDEWPAVAKALTDTPPLEAVALARLLTKAAMALPADDKRSRFAAFEYARVQLEEFRAKSPEKWVPALPTYAALLDRMIGLEPPSQTAKLSMSILFAQLDLAEADTERGAFSDALFALGKAKAATRTMKPADAKDFAGELDAMEKGVRARVTLEAEVDKLQMDAATLDMKGKLSLGIGLLRIGKLTDAAPPLKLSGIKGWQDVAGILASNEKVNPLELAHALRAAAADLKGEEKTEILALARDRYEAFLATNPPDIEKTRVELISGELPMAFAQLSRAKAIDLLTPANFKLITEKGLGHGKVTVDGGTWKLDTDDRTLWKSDWQYKVVEKPLRPDEVRYVGFAWKAESGIDARVDLVTTVQGKYKGYFAGKTANDPALMQLAVDPPRTTTIVVRDLFKDFGGGWTIVGMGMGAVDKSPTQFSGFVLGRSPEQVRRALARSSHE